MMKLPNYSRKKDNKDVTIGLLINDFSLAYQATIGAGVFDAAVEAGINLISFVGGAPHYGVGDYGPPLSAVYELAKPENVDGLIITSPIIASFTGAGWLKQFSQRYVTLPMVSIGANIMELPSVSADEGETLRELITHLITVHGRKRIVFLRGIDGNTESEQRFAIYQQTLAAHHIEYDEGLVVSGQFRFEVAKEAINALLDRNGLCFDAIVASNDYMALGAMDALRAHGVLIPEQVAVTGFDDIEQSSLAWSPLTTIRQSIYQQGYHAVDLLLKRLQGEEIPQSTRLPTEMVIRESCGCFSKEIQQASVDKAPALEKDIEAARQQLLSDLNFIDKQALEELVSAFFAQMQGEKDFLGILRRILNEAISNKQPLPQWQDVISSFRKIVLPYLTHHDELLAENIWHQARILVAEAMHREQAHRQLWAQEQVLLWRDFSSRMAAISNLALLAESTKEVFPKVGIRRCYLALYDLRQAEKAPARRARLVLAYDDQGSFGVQSITQQRLFPTLELLPIELRPRQTRCNFVVEPLFGEAGAEIGYIVVELTNSYDWAAYDHLRTHFTNALKTTILIEQLVEKSHEREEFIQRLAHRTEQINTIMRVGQLAVTVLDIDSLLKTVVKEVQVALDYDVVAIYLLDIDSNALIRGAVIGITAEDASDTAPTSKIQLDAPTLVSAVANSRKAMNSSDMGPNSQLDTPIFIGYVSRSGELIYRENVSGSPDDPSTAQSEVGIPLLIDGGHRLIGVLDIRRNHPDAFNDDDDREILQILANQIAIAIHNAELFHASEKARQNANEANKAKSVFLANMSHELRTPLNAVLGYAQLMARDYNLNAEEHENVNIILRSGEHLKGLINDVLEMSKIESGHIGLIEEDFDFYLLLRSLEEMFRIRAEEKNLGLTFEYAADVPQFVRGDEGKLRQVLINLLGNAIKFTDQGGVTLWTYYQESPTDTNHKQTLFFEIEDTGPGIAPEEIDAIFEPFVQSSSSQKAQEGVGLGLPITKRFIELMGGEIAVENAPNQGAIFRFNIGITVSGPTPIEPCENAGRVTGLQSDQPIPRILVVEDRWENRNWLVKLLVAVGFEVYEATNGQEAILVWEDRKPDLIFMDMRMPVIDGYTATQKIKASPDGTKTLIIALTASAFDHERDRGLAVGCDDFLAKPFLESSIFDKLEQHLKIQFIRESPTPKSLSLAQLRTTPNAFSTSLAALPPGWIMAINEASLKGEIKRVKELIESIRSEHEFVANTLSELIKDFRQDIIYELTEFVLNEQERNV